MTRRKRRLCPGGGVLLFRRSYLSPSGLNVLCPVCKRVLRAKRYRKQYEGRIGIPAHCRHGPRS